jgi:predicted membrane GTPase involved in stress response
MQIGETLCSKEAPVALPTIKVEEPTVSMTFKVRSSYLYDSSIISWQQPKQQQHVMGRLLVSWLQ